MDAEVQGSKSAFRYGPLSHKPYHKNSDYLYYLCGKVTM